MFVSTAGILYLQHNDSHLTFVSDSCLFSMCNLDSVASLKEKEVRAWGASVIRKQCTHGCSLQARVPWDKPALVWVLHRQQFLLENLLLCGLLSTGCTFLKGTPTSSSSLLALVSPWLFLTLQRRYQLHWLTQLFMSGMGQLLVFYCRGSLCLLSKSLLC